MVVTRSKSRSVANVTANPDDRYEHSTPSRRDLIHLAPYGNGTPQEDLRAAGSARNVAPEQEPLVLPHSSGIVVQPRDTHSSRHSHTTRSSTTVRAQKLAIEAEIHRRHAEREKELAERERVRERELARIQQEADEVELRAKLASLEANSDKYSCSRSSSHSHRHRVAAWVGNQHDADAPLDLRPQAVTQIEPRAIDTTASTPGKNTQADPVSQLAKAISALPDRHKRLELMPFSGNINDWLPFKCTYERTKTSFTPTENVARLVAAIRGEARVAIMSVLFEAEDPDEVIVALEHNYARPELVVAQEIAGLRNLKISNVEHLNTLANKLRNCVATIKLLKQEEYLSSIELLRTVLFKLSEHTRDRFTDYASTHKPFEPSITKLELLSRFLVVEAERQLKYNYLVDTTPSSSHSKPPLYKPPVHKFNMPKDLTIHATASKDKTTECSFCKQGSHSVKTCKAYLSLTVDDRWRWVKETKTCYRCLKSQPHTWSTCRVKRCGVDGCTRRHHALLHGNVAAGDNKPNTNTSNLPQSSSTNTVVPQKAGDVIAATFGVPATSTRGLLKILPVVVEGPRGALETFALLDEGSTSTLIDGDVATRIGAENIGRQQLRVTGVGGMFLDTEVCLVNFYIRGRHLPERHFIQGARSITPLQLNPQSTDHLDFSEYDHLVDLADTLAYQNATPTVLIGATDWHLSLSREMRVGKRNEPVASRTLLGWVIHGAISTVSRPVHFIHNTADTSQQLDSLEALIKKQYEIDSLGIQKHTSRQNSDDTRAVGLIESSAERLNTGRFQVGLPWRDNASNNVPDSYPHAFTRLKSLDKQMAKDEMFASAYRTFINDIIEKGYAEQCDPSSYHESYLKNKSNYSMRWYLPHFGVFHPQKRKLRVVHDAAALSRGVSLNSMLLQGPDLLQSLLDILFRFREGPIAFNADIREMFPQIKIKESDRDALRFLWRDGNSQGAVKEFRMSSLIFGAVSSPFIALYLKNKNAKEFESEYSAAALSIIHDHYMDDFIGSQFELSDAARLASDIVTVHKKCCFEMRSWVSNVPEALALVPKELHSNSDSDVNLPPNNDVGALGLKWNPFSDSLGFRTGDKDLGTKITKRSLLSAVMSVYDPLGLLMPIVIQGRILIQRLWREGIDWDSPIPTKYEIECNTWFGQLKLAANFRIPRWYVGRPGVSDTQLHVIADGGEQAYACVAYWRYTFNDGSVSLALIGSKARVTPLKPLSIPRLELQGALIATRLAQTILSAHRTKPSAVFYWTDSTTVLKWIRSDARTFKAFVAHRLGEILESTNPSNWRWLPSDLNIADDATKPKDMVLTATHRWFTGPTFLTNPPNQWPREPEHTLECPTDEALRVSELKPEFTGILLDAPTFELPVPDATRFSSWLRLLRVTARVLQAVRRFKSFSKSPRLFTEAARDAASLSQLSAADVVQAEQLLLMKAQADSFAEELKTLKASQPLPKGSRIAALAPELDKDGLLRLDSRIKSTPGVCESVKSPVILDGHHHIVRLIIMHKHIEAGHGNHELVLNELRQRFWIIRARTTIRSIAKSCLQCRKQNGRFRVPPTGDLPPERLDHHKRPFTHVGLDYFGPIEVAVGRRREKRWVALYTCLVTRAIHLEIVATLSAASAIMSLRRMMARRGTPATIFSDNGTNFVGASRELAALYHGDVQDFATNRRIAWRFIPPASPFMGGAWERLVRSVKSALRSTLKERTPNEEVLATLLLEAESIINSRPLTYVSSSPDAPEAITPFHFILGSSSTTQWPVDLSDNDLLRRCDWRHALRLADHFWERWLKEYLPTLIPRGRRRNVTNFCEGDVVVVVDNTLPRGLWLLGRVTKTFTGPDGLVRVVDVATKGGTLRRPVRKLLPLMADPQPVATRV